MQQTCLFLTSSIKLISPTLQVETCTTSLIACLGRQHRAHMASDKKHIEIN